MEKITFTKKGKEYITLDNEGLFLAEEGISFSPTKTHMIPWKNITKIKLGSVGSRGVVDAQLDIYTNIKKNEVDKATKSATFGFDDFINETITYRLFITDIDDMSWQEVARTMRPLLKDRVPYEGMEEANLERMQNSAMADKVSILIFAGIVIALMVIGKYFEK